MDNFFNVALGGGVHLHPLQLPGYAYDRSGSLLSFLSPQTVITAQTLSIAGTGTELRQKNGIEYRLGIRTADVETYIVRVAVVFGANLTAVIAFVGRLHVLYNQAPLGRPLVIVDADARVRRELEESDRQRMNLVTFTPRHLPSPSSSSPSSSSSSSSS